MDLVISRKIWLRGEGSENSKLLRSSDGKRCCVGIYAKALGVPDSAICGQSWPINHPECTGWRGEEAPWLMSDPQHIGHINDCVIDSSSEWYTVTRINSEACREQLIASIFATHGVNVTFTD